jgi:hypothetical protein
MFEHEACLEKIKRKDSGVAGVQELQNEGEVALHFALDAPPTKFVTEWSFF